MKMSMICAFFEAKLSVFAGDFLKYRIFFESEGQKSAAFWEKQRFKIGVLLRYSIAALGSLSRFCFLNQKL